MVLSLFGCMQRWSLRDLSDLPFADLVGFEGGGGKGEGDKSKLVMIALLFMMFNR